MFCNCRSLMHLNLIMELREAVVQHLAQHCMYFKPRCFAPQQKRAPNMKEDEIISKHHFWGSSSEAANCCAFFTFHSSLYKEQNSEQHYRNPTRARWFSNLAPHVGPTTPSGIIDWVAKIAPTLMQDPAS